MVRDTRQGWAIFAAMSVMFLIGVFVCYGAEQAAIRSSPDWASRRARDRDAAGRQHGRQGSPVRHRAVGAVRHGHHRRELRRRQQHARQLHAARRAGAALQHADRRGDLRRRRRRALRHAALRHPRRVHRRADGRPHAGVHRQEDRAEGSEDGDARPDRDGVQHPRLHRRQLGDSVREGRLLESARRRRSRT